MTPVAGLSGLEILLVNTRVGRNTRHLVAGVRARHQAFPKVTAVVGVLDGPYSQLTPLSGVAVQARLST
jgi:hypothetical protein